MKTDNLINDIFIELIKSGIYEHDLPNKDNKSYEIISNKIKECILKIASDAYNEGFVYGISSHISMKQNHLSKAQYSQKLHNEL